MSHSGGPAAPAESDAAQLVARLTERGLTIAIAESLTGGLVTAELVSVPGASKALLGGVVAYSTTLKASLVGVDPALLAERGAVDPEVAQQMADRVRRACAVDGRPADVGLATTGVAGPDPQDGHAAGTVFVAVASARGIRSVALQLTGDRARIRQDTVAAALREALAELAEDVGSGAEYPS
jgi:nicotinamide-nucleotide amidase